MKRFSYSYLLAFTPLLLGVGSSTSALTVDKAPLCDQSKAEFLTYSGGSLTCRSIAGATPVPDCKTPGKLLTATKNGDVSALACIDKGQGSVSQDNLTQISSLKDKVTKLGDIINGLKGASRPGVWVGNTDMDTAKAKTTQTGKISRAGSATGLIAANDLCNDAFPGDAGDPKAHMCTAYEMYNTVAQGKLHMGDTIAKAWIFAPSWKTPLAGLTSSAQAGLADTCGDMTDDSTANNWAGIQVEWNVLETGAAGFRFWGGSQAPCNVAAPIACCR